MRTSAPTGQSPETVATQMSQQILDQVGQTINELGQQRSHPARKRQRRSIPTRPELSGLGPNVERLLKDTNETVEATARNLSVKGVMLISPQQITTLRAAGVPERDLLAIANLNGLTFSHLISDIHNRMQAICSVPETPADQAPDWSQWVYQSRNSYIYVRPADMSQDPLGQLLERTCEKIANAAWANLPDASYVAKALAQETSQPRATQFAVAMRQCYKTVGRIDPRLRTTDLQIFQHGTAQEHPGTHIKDAKPCPYPSTPTAISDAIEHALGPDFNYEMDMGEVAHIPTLAREMPADGQVYLNHQGDVWYSKEGSNHHILHDYLESDQPEDRSTWPDYTIGMPPDISLTKEERTLALMMAPPAPFPTPSSSNSLLVSDPVSATAWLNRITREQALARLNGRPEPQSPSGQCSYAGECPTPCGYVQRVQLLSHTLFPDGSHEDCDFRRFRAMHGTKPEAARKELAKQLLQKTGRTAGPENAHEPAQQKEPEHPRSSRKDNKPTQNTLF